MNESKIKTWLHKYFNRQVQVISCSSMCLMHACASLCTLCDGHTHIYTCMLMHTHTHTYACAYANTVHMQTQYTNTHTRYTHTQQIWLSTHLPRSLPRSLRLSAWAEWTSGELWSRSISSSISSGTESRRKKKFGSKYMQHILISLILKMFHKLKKFNNTILMPPNSCSHGHVDTFRNCNNLTFPTDTVIKFRSIQNNNPPTTLPWNANRKKVKVLMFLGFAISSNDQ